MLVKEGHIYVLGASGMMDYINPSFFIGKTSIGCNYLYKRFPVTYTITKHIVVIRDWMEQRPNTRLVSPRITEDLGGVPFTVPDIEMPDLFSSRSIMGTAIDFARYLGADEITVLGWEATNEYMNGYKPMKDQIKTQLFNKANRDQVGLLIDNLQRKHRIRVNIVSREEALHGIF